MALTPYEREREARMAQNRARMALLGLTQVRDAPKGLAPKTPPRGSGLPAAPRGRLGGASGAAATAGNDLGRPPHPQSPLQPVSLTPGPLTRQALG